MGHKMILLQQHRWNSEFKSYWMQMGGRKNWTFTLRVTSFPTAGSAEVVIEAIPYGGLETDWTQLTSFGVQSGPVEIIKRFPEDYTLTPYKYTFIRAHILPSIKGLAIMEVRAEAPFFDLGDAEHEMMLSKELRSWEDGVDRIVDQSEEEIIDDIIGTVWNGELALDLQKVGATEVVRREIALQAEHNKRRAVLERSGDPAALVSLRNMTRGYPGRSERLRKFRYAPGGVWLGR